MIKNFHKSEPSLARLSDIPVPSQNLTIVFDEPAHDSERENLFDLVFAPGDNGFPSSDLSINAETLRDPSVQKFVNDNLRQVYKPTLQSYDDNEVLDSVKSKFESVDSYALRQSQNIDNLNSDSDDKDL